MLKQEIWDIFAKGNKSEYRKFGLTLGIFLQILAGILFWRESQIYQAIFFIGAGLTVLGIILPKFLKPFYLLWMGLAVTIGHVMSRVILTLIFVLVFAPVGLVMRMLRKDLLKEKFDPSASSYWIQGKNKPFDPTTTEKQY
jgi:hypothetical protein